MLTAAIDSKISGHEKWKMLLKGLVTNHAYSVLDAKQHPSKNLQLVMLRNPWAKSLWNGIVFFFFGNCVKNITVSLSC